MDVFEVVKEVKELLNKFPNFNKEEMKKLRLLTRNLSCDLFPFPIDNFLYDMEIQEKYENIYNEELPGDEIIEFLNNKK